LREPHHSSSFSSSPPCSPCLCEIKTGSPAAVGVTVSGNTITFTFEIPAGQHGPPGEVSQNELISAILTTALNPDNVSPIGANFMDPISATDLNTVAGKLDELIGALKRSP
jgi:hypothetical protein